MSIPWWAWIVVILLIVLLLFYSSIKSYRRQLRTAFLEYLEREHPDLEAREISSREIGITAADGEEGTLFLHRLYREGAGLDTEDKEAQSELFARFATVILEGQGAMEVDPERDAKRIFPRIVPASFPEQAAAQVGTSALPALSLGPPGLVVVFVLDSEQSVAYLSDEQLVDLGVSVEEALGSPQ